MPHFDVRRIAKPEYFRPRHLPARLKPADRQSYLRSAPLPSIDDAATFGPRLLQIEQDLGTSQMTVVGFCSSAGIVSPERVMEGLEGIDALISRTLAKNPRPSLEWLADHYAPKMIFASGQNDFLPALKNFSANLANEASTLRVGDCVVEAAIFALVARAAGYSYAVKFYPDKFHVKAIFLNENRFFDAGVNHPWTLLRNVRYRRNDLTRFWELSRSAREYVGGTFMFFPSPILQPIDEILKKKSLEHPSRSKWDEASAIELAARITTALSINPFYDFAYQQRSELLKAAHEASGRAEYLEAAATSERHGQVIKDLIIQGHLPETVEELRRAAL